MRETSANGRFGRAWFTRLVGVAGLGLAAAGSLADPFPPTWGTGTPNEAGGPIHFAPAAWPSEPADPKDCANTCGQWRPYTRFQGDINDPRVQDPSNGGTSPQNYVNVSSSCIDKTYPSIYYYLHKGATEAEDVIMFRWRVEQIAHNYATGPSAGNYGATDPWSSGLWTVLFDVDGDGYRDLAAHLNGSSGDPSHAIDMIAGIWGNIPTQSVDYLSDPSIHLIAHNPTAFTSGSKLLNFNSDYPSSAPTTTWPAGAATKSWDYGTTRAKLVYTNSCNEYFVDYQIPVRMLDASSTGPNPALNGPKITRNTPISMLFCTANSLNNPFQKDCSLNRTYLGDSAKPGPFGDYLSFNKEQPYSQPIVSSVTATAPVTCPGSYTLATRVQDTLYVDGGGAIQPSIQSVKFYYWYDKDNDGTADADDAGSQWVEAATGVLKPGSLNTWTASWNATGLLKGKYLIGVQAVDNRLLHDDGVADAPVNNRAFSYLPGSSVTATQAQIYINPWNYDPANKAWISGGSGDWVGTGADDQEVLFPAHSPAQNPSTGENWYGNPDVTGVQTALVGVAINACGLAPQLLKSADVSQTTVGQPVRYTLSVVNRLGSALSLDSITDTLPDGFAFAGTQGPGDTPASSLCDGACPVPGNVGNAYTWTFATPASIPGGCAGPDYSACTETLVYNTTAANTVGSYNNTASATTGFGSLPSNAVQVGVGAPRLTLAKTPSIHSAVPGASITYSLRYANDSPVNATGVVLTDVIPNGLTYVGCSGACTCVDNDVSGTCNVGDTLTWNIGTLAAGEGPYTVGFTATITDPYPVAAAVPNVNGATIDGDNTDPTSATASVFVSTPRPQLVLGKTANKTVVDPAATAPGNQVTFTLAYANNGDAAATGVTLSDPLPAGFTFVSCSNGCSNPGVGSNGTVSWNLGSLGIGASGSVTVTAQVANPYTAAANPVTNTATLDSTETSPVTDSTEVGVRQSGQLCKQYYLTNATASVGTLTGTEVGRPTVNLANPQRTLTTATPTGTTTLQRYIPLNSNPVPEIEVARFYQEPVSGQLINFDGSSAFSGFIYYTKSAALGGAANSNLTLYVKAYDYDPATGSQTLLGTASYVDNGSPSPPVDLTNVTPTGSIQKGHRLLVVVSVIMAQNKDTTVELRVNSTQSYAEVCAAPPANLMIDKAVSATSLAATGSGRTLTYTINYANTSAATGATGALITDTLPAAGVSYASCSVAGSTHFLGCSESGGVVTFHNGSGAGVGIPANGSGSVSVTVNVANDLAGITRLDNTAGIASTQTALVTASASTAVLGGEDPAGTPNLVLSKQADKTLLIPGDTVTYTLTALNAGTKTAAGVLVSDDFPDETWLTYAGNCSTATGSCAESPPGTLAWNLGSLAPGAAATLTFGMTVGSGGNAPPSGVTTRDNLATATYTGCAAPPCATSNAVTVAISTNPNLALLKTVTDLNGGGVEAGDVLSYTLTVSNNGSGAASGVSIGDPIPAYTSFVTGSITASQGSGSFDAVDNRVVFDVGSLAPSGQAGDQAVYSFRVSVNPSLPPGNTPIANTAAATAANAAGRTSSTLNSASAAPLLSLAKAGPGSQPYPATTVTATASNATTLFVASTANLELGQTVRVPAPDTTPQYRRITGLTGTSLGLDAALDAASGAAVLGGVAYDLTYRNVGDADASNVVLTDTLPAGLGYYLSDPVANGHPGTGNAGVVTWNLGALAAGDGGTVRVIAFPTQAGTVTNLAAIQSTEVTTPVTANRQTVFGGLEVWKSTSTPMRSAGGTATYTLVVTNGLAAPVDGVTLTDALPAGFTFASTGAIVESGAGTARTATSNPVPGDAQPVWGEWTLGANGSLSITFDASIDASAGPATYQNGVTVSTTTAGVGITPFDPLLTTAEDVTVLAAGTGVVEGTVYRDGDGNGSFDASVDTPLAGVAVTIIAADGTAYVVYTDAAGYFNRVVVAGAAIVDVDNGSLPAGLVLTSGADGSDPDTVIVPDGGSVTDNTGYFAVVNAASLATISGTVFNDNGSGGGTASNGAQDGSEPGMLGVQVVLRNATTGDVVATAYSDVLGNYSFPNVPAGDYRVDLVPSAGYFVTSGNDPQSVSVVGGGSADVDFGQVQGQTLSGTVFNDNGGITGTADSGVQDGDEAGTNAGGLNVVVVNSSNEVLAVTPVAANGGWSAGVPGGSGYQAYVTTANPTVGSTVSPAAGLPSGWQVTGENVAGTVDGTANGRLAGIDASSGASGLNFGIRSTATTYSVSGTVFNDNGASGGSAGDGLKQAGEGGTNAGGLYVLLVNGSGDVVGHATVAANGSFTLSGVAAGSYTLRLSRVDQSSGAAPAASLPLGWTHTGESLDNATLDGPANGNLAVSVVGATSGIALGIRQVADLLVHKNGPAAVDASGVLRYTVRVFNAGPAPANGANFTDPLPAGVTGMSWTCGEEVGDAVCPNGGGVGAISELIAVLPAGGGLTYTVIATAPSSGTVVNTATIASPSGLHDPDSGNNSDAVTTVVGPASGGADLAVIKTGPATVAAGGSVTYAVQLSNAGPSPANNAIFADDAVSAGLASVSWSCVASGGAICPEASGNGAINATIATFPAGGHLLYTVSGTAPASGSVTNTATVTVPSGVSDPTPGNNSDSATTNVAATAGSADLAIAKSGPATVSAGGKVTYTLRVINTGPDGVLDARVLDVAPSVLTDVSWTCGAGMGGGSCDQGSDTGDVDTTVDLPAGASVTLTVSGTAPASGAFVNSAEIIPPAGTHDPDSRNNLGGPVITQIVVATLSGVVFNDNGSGGGTATDGLQNGTEPGIDPGNLNVIVVGSGNVVIAVAAVNADGTWSTTVPAGSSYDVFISTASPAIGATLAPTATMPTNWSVTGETRDGINAELPGNGILAGLTVNASTDTLDFGVRSLVPDMTVTLDLPAVGSPGATNVTGTLTCTNSGSGTATSATCTASGTGVTVGTCIASSGSASSLPAGATLTCTVTVSMPGAAGGSDTAETSVAVSAETGALNDGDTDNNTASDSVAVIDAVNDGSSNLTQSASGTTAYSLLGNDTAGSSGAALGAGGNVTQTLAGITQNGNPFANGGGEFSLDSATGELIVKNTTAVGTYVVTYQICASPSTTPSACDTATKTVVVSAAPPPTYSLSGTVFNDNGASGGSAGDGLKQAGEGGTNAGGLYVLLVNGSGDVVGHATVAANGSFTLSGVAAGSYTLRLSKVDQASGAAPAASLPTGYGFTGDSLNGASLDGAINGSLAVTVGSANLSGITFGVVALNIFDPPFGAKVGELNGNAVIRWTMVWINDSPIAANGVVITDPPPVGTHYLGNLLCTPFGTTTVSSCNFEAPSVTHPRGRVVVQANMGADAGATDAASAANELTIRFDVSVDNPNQAQTIENQGTLAWDRNGDPVTVTSDDRAQPGSDDPTPVSITPAVVAPIPAASPAALWLLALLLGGLGLAGARRRRGG